MLELLRKRHYSEIRRELGRTIALQQRMFVTAKRFGVTSPSALRFIGEVSVKEFKQIQEIEENSRLQEHATEFMESEARITRLTEVSSWHDFQLGQLFSDYYVANKEKFSTKAQTEIEASITKIFFSKKNEVASEINEVDKL